MTTTKTILVTGFLALLAACGGQPSNGVDLLGSSQSDLLLPGGTIEMRMRGVHPSGFSSVAVTTHSVHVWADGVPQPVTIQGTHMNLAHTGQAWLFATFTLPLAATTVHLEVQLDNPGSYAHGSSSGSVDLYERPIALDVEAAQLRSRGKIVLHDDLSRSLTPEGSGLLFLPDLVVSF